MKSKLMMKKVLVLFVFAHFLSSCNLDDGVELPIAKSNIVDLALTSPDLFSLVTALDLTDLTSTLQGNGPFTVLAPTNAAFDNFLSANGYANLEAVPKEVLRQILLNHVVAGKLDSAPLIALQRNYLQTLADGPAESKLSLYFDAVNGITFNNSSTITQADVAATNGIIHIVDQVIALPTLDTFIASDDNFEIFGSALDVVTPLSDVPNSIKESSEGPFTVFIPIEQAFDNLLATNDNWNFVSDIEENLLTAVIEHHFLNGNLRSTNIVAGEMEATIEGDNITFVSLDGNLEITDGSGNEGAIIGITDIQAINGVIHAIPNNVLLPDTSN